MNFLLSPDLEEFVDVLEKFFTSRFDSRFLRKQLIQAEATPSSAAKISEPLWKEFIDLGLLAASIPETHDGLGFGALAASLISEQAGQALLTSPLLETIILGAIPLTCLASEDKKKELLPQVASGKLRLSGAFVECYATLPSGKSPFAYFSTQLPVKSSKTASGTYTISGALQLVPAVEEVDALLVPALDENGTPSLFLVSLAVQLGKTIRASKEETFDLLRNYSTLEFSQAEAQLLSNGTIDSAAWDFTLHTIALLWAAEMLGASSRVLAMSLEHVKTRTQYGKPVGSFQAVAHKLADMHLALESARSLVRFAAWAADKDHGQFASAAAAAKAYCSEYMPKLIQTGLQVHGGIGFTHEYDLHLYLRRARVLSTLFGSAGGYYRELSEVQLGRDSHAS